MSTHIHGPEWVFRGSACDFINNGYISIMLVKSIHAGVFAQTQEFLKWLILEKERDGKCEKKYIQSVLRVAEIHGEGNSFTHCVKNYKFVHNKYRRIIPNIMSGG